jgi:hypothetical protein
VRNNAHAFREQSGTCPQTNTIFAAHPAILARADQAKAGTWFATEFAATDLALLRQNRSQHSVAVQGTNRLAIKHESERRVRIAGGVQRRIQVRAACRTW